MATVQVAGIAGMPYHDMRDAILYPSHNSPGIISLFLTVKVDKT